MSVQLQRFCVEGLYGAYSYDVALTDNRLILVGENGTGKSTLASLFFFFLSAQWERLAEFDFRTIQVAIDGEELELKSEDLQNWTQKPSMDVLRHGPPLTFKEYIQKLANHFQEDSDIHLLKSQSTEKALNAIKNRVFGAQYLFLPTYRRIEQSLHKLSAGTRERSSAGYLSSRRGENSLELIEFGMEDVKRHIKEHLEGLKENLRSELNALTGRYLRDVIRGSYKDVSLNMAHLEPRFIATLFEQMDDSILLPADKDLLKKVVAKFREKETIHPEDRVVAHFLSQLIELHQAQAENERSVRKFVAVCNHYLVNKELVYDNSKFQVSVISRESEGREYEWDVLSSGEKQIISLFSHLYLAAPFRSLWRCCHDVFGAIESGAR